MKKLKRYKTQLKESPIEVLIGDNIIYLSDESYHIHPKDIEEGAQMLEWGTL